MVWVGACRPAPPEAPTEIDELIHFFLQQVDGEDPELVGDGVENLAEIYTTSSSVEDGLASGQVSSVTQAEFDALEDMAWEPDPSLTVGVYTLRTVDCSLEQMVSVYLEPDQMALFPDNYVDYVRTFDTDAECFADGSCDVVDYHSLNTDKLAGFEMVYTMVTRLRRFRYMGEGEGEDEQQVILGRNVMPEPAEESVNAGGFEQGYHIEAHIPWEGDQVLHLYGLWNYGYLDGVSGDMDFWPNQYLDGLLELDDQIEALCVNGEV